MPLAEYLASEQAREDVKALLDGREEFVGPDGICLITGPEGQWRAVNALDDAGELLGRAYYRPDGDRYVVTDLGEGWRQHRLRTGRVDWTAEIIAACDYNPYIVDTGERATAGDCENLILKASDLPDAICRVMLASLRVAQS